MWRMKRNVTGLLGMMVAILLFPTITVQAKENRIHSGVYIETVDVGNMTKEEADQALEEYLTSLQEAEVVLEASEGKTLSTTAGELGLTIQNPDVVQTAMDLGKTGNLITRYKAIKDLEKYNHVLELKLDFDKELIATLVEEKCTKFNQEALDLHLVRENDGFRIEEGQTGILVDTENSENTIYDFLTTNWKGGTANISLVMVTDEPVGTKAELEKVKDIIGSYSTSFHTSGTARSANVTNGTRLVNGITLYPGDTFSMYDNIKPFSEANGYYMAGSYLNGMVVDSLGGGICQVSTTLYNAVLKAELEVTERHNHSMIVSYVQPSADAAIAESSGKDFKFVNNKQYPIYIEGYTTPEKEVVFNIYGVEDRPANRVVTYENEVLETIQPTTEKIVPSGAQPVGFVSAVQSAHIGYKARLWKIVTVDGKQVSKEQVNSSNYNMAPRTITVGTATDNPDAYNQIQAAIATGSIDYVRAVAGALASAQPVPPAPAPAPAEATPAPAEVAPIEIPQE